MFEGTGDGQISLTSRYQYQTVAFSTEFKSSAQISTVAVVRAITAAAGELVRRG